MISVADTQRLIADRCPALAPEAIPLAEALGRVLRETVSAPEDLPAFDRSAMDGYAVLADDPGPHFRLIGEIRAGDANEIRPERGEAVRIFTGARLPGAGLQVIRQEGVEALGPTQVAVRHRDPSLNIRFRGEDAQQGTALLQPGVILRAGELALLASLGYVRPSVSRLPRVVHFVTGDEIVAPEATPRPGQIRDANSTLLRTLLAETGVAVTQGALPEALDAALPSLRADDVQTADLLLISGGASVGRYDFTRSLLEQLGYTVHVDRVNVRPGKPLIFASRGPQVAFGLPGNPVSHLACFHLFVATALRSFLGLQAAAAVVAARLGQGLDECHDARPTWAPARTWLREGQLWVAPMRWRSSGDVTGLAGVNALFHIPAETTNLPADSLVSVLPLTDILSTPMATEPLRCP